MKVKAIVFTVCLLSGLVIGYALAAENDGPAVIKIDINGAKKAVPAFPHRIHQNMPELKGKCQTCHHTWKKGQKIQPCGKCHTDARKTNPKTKAPGFEKAFHKLCRDCHKKHDKKLAKCKTCHK